MLNDFAATMAGFSRSEPMTTYRSTKTADTPMTKRVPVSIGKKPSFGRIEKTSP